MKDFMMPATVKQTRKVEIYTYETTLLVGLKFFDSNDTLIFEIGDTEARMKHLLIAADEQIIGFKANILKEYPSSFFDLRFMICKRS
jgi:hypothetical protein